MRCRMNLAGVDISESECWELIDFHHRVGRADDLHLAARIEDSLGRRQRCLILSPAERELMLSVLDDPPPGKLFELRAVLVLERFE